MTKLAVILVVAFLVLHLAGGREAVGFLSGSGDSVPPLGALYVLAWFGAVIVAPVLGIAGGISSLVERRDRIAKWIAGLRR